MLAWLLLAAAAVVVVAFALRRSRAARRRGARKPAQTRYPVVLAHGFLGFDEIGVGARKHLYFRGVGSYLESMGAQVYSPRVPPASSIAVRAQRLADLIRALPDPRVNIVAHSMGGLDARYAISQLGLGAARRLAHHHRHAAPRHAAGERRQRAVRRHQPDAAPLLRPGRIRRSHQRRDGEFNAEVPDASGVAYASIVGRSRQAADQSPALALAPLPRGALRRERRRRPRDLPDPGAR